MSAKSQQTSPRTLAEINKKIIEIKKKIQLSEGQRKAAFEQYETERKINEDEILKLKRENKELLISLNKNKDDNAEFRVHNSKIEAVIGSLNKKTLGQVKELLDLQIIDQNKKLDLIKDKVRKRQRQLAEIAKEYQTLLSKKPKKEMTAKIKNLFKQEETHKKVKKKPEKRKKADIEKEMAPKYKKKFYDLQNSIHRIEVQWREASHVKNCYKAIKASLLRDRSQFESSLNDLEEKKLIQDRDIKELEKMNSEASGIRSSAKQALEKEEKSSIVAAKIREKQSLEQQALYSARRVELERLERRIFQTGKMSGPQTGGSTAGVPEREMAVNDVDEDTERTEEDVAPPEEDTRAIINNAFEKLKEATGATTCEEVFDKFKAQKDSRNRLDYLKKTTEKEKIQLQLKQTSLNTELERYKYSREKNKEKMSENLLSIQDQIQILKEKTIQLEESIKERKIILSAICNSLYNIYSSLENIGVKIPESVNANPENSFLLIVNLTKEIVILANKRNIEDEDNLESDLNDLISEQDAVDEMEDALPELYNVFLRRSPLPSDGPSLPKSTASEDEDEVPSRNYLKKQAQLVVDAKSRRKALRFPMNRK